MICLHAKKIEQQSMVAKGIVQNMGVLRKIILRSEFASCKCE